jgi:hypothetical protein
MRVNNEVVYPSFNLRRSMSIPDIFAGARLPFACELSEGRIKIEQTWLGLLIDIDHPTKTPIPPNIGHQSLRVNGTE